MATRLGGARRPMRTAGAVDRPGRTAAILPGARARSRVSAPTGASGVGDRSARSCDDAADDRHVAGSAGPLAVARGARRARWPLAAPAARARARPGRAADRRRRCCSAGRSSRCRPSASWSPSAGGVGRPAGQRGPSGQPGPAPPDRGVLRRDAGARLRAAVGDRALRHDALLGPHGPARAADAGRGARCSPWPRRSPCSCALSSPGDPPSLDPAGPPFAGRAVPGLPGHGLGDVRGDDVGGPLLAAVQRVARGPVHPRPRARRCS